MNNRNHTRALAREFNERNDPTGWFEALYAGAGGEPSGIPWADLRPNPNLIEWLKRNPPVTDNRRAIKVGCGLGDDAEELARIGFDVTAFDISPSAIA